MSAAIDKRAIIDRELARIHKTQGKLDPAELVRQASAKSSPLHNCFEWDDTKAAHKHRLAQAYQLILASKFVVSLKSKTPTECKVVDINKLRGYLPTEAPRAFTTRGKVLGSRETRREYIETKIKEFASLCNSVSDIREFDNLRKIVKAELAKI